MGKSWFLSQRHRTKTGNLWERSNNCWQHEEINHPASKTAQQAAISSVIELKLKLCWFYSMLSSLGHCSIHLFRQRIKIGSLNLGSNMKLLVLKYILLKCVCCLKIQKSTYLAFWHWDLQFLTVFQLCFTLIYQYFLK